MEKERLLKEKLKLLKRLKVIENELLISKTTKEERFLELMSQLTSLRINKIYPESIFGFVGEKYLWEYNKKNKTLWLSYILIWSVFKREYDMYNYEIQQFTKSMVERAFDCKDLTIRIRPTKSSNWVERAFDCKDLTTSYK